MKTRSDFVSNSSSCSFFVAIDTPEDAREFCWIVDALLEQRVYMELFCSLDEARARRGGVPFDGSVQMQNALVPGCFVLCDSGDDHDECFESRFYSMLDLFAQSGYAFKLYADAEAHLTVPNDLPKKEDA